MIESVEISKRAEAYVKFAFWCLEHKISGRRTAECIDLFIKAGANAKGTWRKREGLLAQVKERLEDSGMTHVFFEYGWPVFYCPHTGDTARLPFQGFI